MEQRSLASYIPPGCKESDVTERLTQSSGLKNLLLRKIYFKHQPSQLYPSVVVQLLSHVQLFATPWTAVHHSLAPGVYSNSIQPSRPLLLTFPLTFNLSEHQGLF